MSAERARPGTSPVPGYRVLGLIRRGEDVDVYDAWSEERDCRCVLKLLRPDRRHDRRARTRLLDEGRMLVAFTHPHLVRAYEVVTRPAPAVVLETLSGDTLGALIGWRGPRLPLAEVCVLGIQLASALTYLHRNAVLHLDLKPSNIVVHLDQAKLIDLSIARPPGPGRAGVGTAAYMAPEQVRGGPLSAATDVWGLGAVLYEAATRETPFGEDGVGAAGTDEPVPAGRRRRMPGAVAGVIDACLRREPDARPPLGDVTRVLRSALPG